MWRTGRIRTLKAMAHNGFTASTAPATSGTPRTPSALITGASRGLGLALARSLAADGWRLIIDARDPGALEAAAAELAEHTTVVALAGDVASEEHRLALAEAAAAAGGFDVVVHNASLLGPSPQPALADYPLEKLREVYSVNVFAPLRLTQLLLPHLRPGARLVFVTSDASVEAYEGWGGYGSSKAALDQVAAVLAAEQPGFRVYAVDPGDMNTRMHQEAFPGEDISDRPPPEASLPGLREILAGHLPSGRYQARNLPVGTPR
jgi:NAD(P)-dependent dehydrogenase (short-subunit alcohol dehydrogenase family)